jgi:hypothetical protein
MLEMWFHYVSSLSPLCSVLSVDAQKGKGETIRFCRPVQAFENHCTPGGRKGLVGNSGQVEVEQIALGTLLGCHFWGAIRRGVYV